MAPEVVAITPVKPLAVGKGRLAPVLPALERQALTLLGLHRVLQAIGGARLVTEALVIGKDEAVRRLAQEMEAGWLEDPGWDLNESLREGFAHAFRGGAEACLFLPADLPMLTASGVDSVVAASDGLSRLVLAPAHDGGTNAILLPRGVPFQPRMGQGSLVLHLEEAQGIGIAVEVERSPGLAFDVDTPRDLQRLRERSPTLEADIKAWRSYIEGVGATHASTLQ